MHPPTVRPPSSTSVRTASASAIASSLACMLAGCMVGPNYQRPSAPISPAFKEAAPLPPEGWVRAEPSDAATRGDWWTVFGDPVLNDLEGRVATSNQTLAQAEAAYREARALVAQDRAALFPTVALSAGATAEGGGSAINSGQPGEVFSLGLGGSWEPDIWGAVRRNIEGARANAEASADLVANARLSSQTELAADYVQLRMLDEEKRLFDDTVIAYQRTLTITQNKYDAGVVARGDVLTAQSNLDSARATDIDIVQQRARSEHAIALLAGQAPATLTLASAPWTLQAPQIPAGVPADLLQRRPDVAAAERNAASASAQIGVAVAAYYPNLTLTGQGGFESSELGNLVSAPQAAWSVGASLAETIFDAGARKARVTQTRAAYDQTVAIYRQTVLNALGQVEDDLAAQRVLAGEAGLRRSAADAAKRAQDIALNEYRAGTVDFTAVTAAEQTTLAARISELSVQAARLSTSVDLIAALGGGWSANTSPKPTASR